MIKQHNFKVLFNALLLSIGLLVNTVNATAFSLSQYQLISTVKLPKVSAYEASAVTWNWDTDSLFVVGDDGHALVEVNRAGQQLSVMALTGFRDTEGLTYVGNNQFVITEERIRDAYRIEYVRDSMVKRSDLLSKSLGDTIETNTGLEGISFDARDGSFVTVKERMPQEINVNQFSFDDVNTPKSTSLFDADNLLYVRDLADVQVLSRAYAGTRSEDNLLVLSQDSNFLMEINRQGDILSALDLDDLGLVDSIEGVTIDDNGVLFLVAENDEQSLMYILHSGAVDPPVSAVFWLFGCGLLMWVVVLIQKRKRLA